MKVMLSFALLAVSIIYMVSADPGKPSKCCIRVSRGKPSPAMKIERFDLQTANPPCVEAVRFFTNTNRIMCAPPNLPWVKRKQAELSKKQEEQKTE
ncbi:C-C motif chemokine 19-like [Hyla sarda]|uniref:C-C motif chemokine 19-like n=1 Tax=Hyla sarda TaxID=327740 RepID=UPI0024C26149|nr:C-C motif chemokine 19-like [Hyla sarda]